MKKKKDYTTEKTAGTGAVIGATAGIIKGGAIGIAGFGGAVGVPLFVPLACIGAVAGLSYGLYKKAKKKGQGFRLLLKQEKDFKVTEDQISKKAKEAQEDLLNAVFELFKKNPDQFLTASKVGNKLDLLKGHNNFFPHGLLIELMKMDKLEKDTEKRKKGFRLKR